MKAVLVGFGSIGKRHARNLRTLVPDADITVVRRAAAEPGDGVDRVVTDLDAALADRPDVVFVTSPATHHVDQALRAVRAGAHVFIEKPLAATMQGVDELRDAVASANVVAVVAYPFRFYDPLIAIKRAVDDGRIGRVQSLRAEVGMDLSLWRPTMDYRDSVSAQKALGGGALRELSHELDLALWLAGDVRRVHAVTAKLSDLELDVEDLAELILEFESGAIGSVHVDMIHRVPYRALRVAGSSGSITWSWQTHEARIWTADEPEWTLLESPNFEPNQMYLNAIQHFLDCINGSASPRVTIEDGAAALRLVLAAERSSDARA